MKIIYSLLFILSACATPQQKETVSFKDLEPLQGNWTGTQIATLANDDSQINLPTTSVITLLKGSLELSLTATQADGQAETEKGTLSINEDGRKLVFGQSEYDIQAVKRNKDELTIIAGKEDEDNDKPADIRLTITTQPGKLIMLREVKYKGTGEYFTRIKLEMKKK